KERRKNSKNRKNGLKSNSSGKGGDKFVYYVNQEQISIRLAVIPALTDTMNMLQQNWTGSAIERLAQERALHIAIEVVTDVGSYLIDGFLMRDASSYEDIVEITAGEGVYPDGMK